MAKSPCIGCEFELADKNNPTCRECDRRVEYVALIEKETNIEHLPRQGASTAGRTSNIQRRMKKTSVIPACLPRLHGQAKVGHVQKKREYHKSTLASPSAMPRQAIIDHQSKECLIKGCDEEVYCRGLCRNHYQQWYKGYIDHPVLGKYKVAQPKKNSMKKDKGEQIMDKDKTGSHKPEAKKTKAIKKAALPPLVAVQLSLYPEIHKAVYDTAEKFFVTPEHVIIGLLGEALASRRERSDHE